MAVEVVIKVGVQLLFWVGDGGWVVVGEWSDYTKSILISTKVEVVVEVGFEKIPDIKLSRVVGGGWKGGLIMWD